MDVLEPIKFAVGEAYRNEKGPFEVVAIQGPDMVIRWESGAVTTTPVRLQRRIQERLRWEKSRPAKPEDARPTGHAPSKAAGAFAGLDPEDFHDSNAGRTPWRSRSQLGGAVTRRLRARHPRVDSWAAKHRNAVDWADARHWKMRPDGCGVKFSALASGAEFAWGLHVVRSGPALQDWEALAKWLTVGGREAWLQELACKAGMKVYDVSRSGLDLVLSPGDAGWVGEGGSRLGPYAGLGQAIDTLPAENGCDLLLARRLSKQEALGIGKEIAQRVSELFGLLWPIYDAAATPFT